MSRISSNKTVRSTGRRFVLASIAAATLSTIVGFAVAPAQALARDRDHGPVGRYDHDPRFDRGDRFDHDGHVSVDIRIGDRPAPVYQERTTRVWVEPAYRTVVDRAWHPAVYRDDYQRTWVPDRFEVRTIVENYRGHRTEREVRTLISPAHWEDVHAQVLVSDGYYETITRQELVCAGHWEERVERVAIEQPCEPASPLGVLLGATIRIGR